MGSPRTEWPKEPNEDERLTGSEREGAEGELTVGRGGKAEEGRPEMLLARLLHN